MFLLYFMQIKNCRIQIGVLFRNICLKSFYKGNIRQRSTNLSLNSFFLISFVVKHQLSNILYQIYDLYNLNMYVKYDNNKILVNYFVWVLYKFIQNFFLKQNAICVPIIQEEYYGFITIFKFWQVSKKAFL